MGEPAPVSATRAFKDISSKLDELTKDPGDSLLDDYGAPAKKGEPPAQSKPKPSSKVVLKEEPPAVETPPPPAATSVADSLDVAPFGERRLADSNFKGRNRPKMTITLPLPLVEEIQRRATEEDKSFSRILQEAYMHYRTCREKRRY